MLINGRFTLLNRSFIENKGRSAVINVSRTSGRLFFRNDNCTIHCMV